MDEEKKNPVDEFFETISVFDWPDLKKERNTIFIDRDPKVTIFKQQRSTITIELVWYDRENDEYKMRANPHTIIFNKSTPISDLFYIDNRRYKLTYDGGIKEVLELGTDIEKLDIKKSHKSINVSKNKKEAKVPLEKFILIRDEIASATKIAKSYQDSVRRHYLNEITRKYRRKTLKRVTTFKKGEFDFLVKRFHLDTKKKSSDFEKYLGKKDITALQELSRELIRNRIFEKDFLKELDDYFIRKKLADIIKLGRKILALKSTNLKTKAALSVIKEISPDKTIGQLETVWQNFFDDYLLYLIFSYKSIFSKIELELEGEDKTPDFIGVNHYNGLDIIEIKTHLTPALVWDNSHKNYSFSSDLSKAIIQTTNYIDAIKEKALSDDDVRKITAFTDEENLYRPRGVIIVSSKDYLVKNNRGDLTKVDRDFTKLRNSLHDIEILTFDEVIDIADRYTKNIVNED